GPEPRDPASMLRSYLLYLLVGPQLSIDEWVLELHHVPLYISRFEPGDVPGVGTFHHFFQSPLGFRKETSFFEDKSPKSQSVNLKRSRKLRKHRPRHRVG